MCGLKLKKIWDDREGSLYYKEQRRMSQQGILDYWKSVDAAIKFWDKTLKDIMIKHQKKNPLQETTYHPKHNLQKMHHMSSARSGRTTHTEHSRYKHKDTHYHDRSKYI